MTAGSHGASAQEKRLEPLIGELCREGKTIHYITARGGKVREGSHAELIDFLVRNGY